MRKARNMLLLILLALGVYAAFYGHQAGWFGPAGQGAGSSKPDADAAKADVVRPSFDIVRAEPSGEIVMAGRAEPNWIVTVESNGQTVGTATADANGEWIIQPKTPLARGEHALELKAQDPNGGRTVFSKQRIALSLTEPGQERPLVAMTEEGKATRVLQMPPQTAAGEKPVAAKPVAKADATGDLGSRVGFSALDYEEAGPKSMLHMSGQATPGARLMLYIDNEFAGTTAADATGRWTFSGNRELTGGGHDIRADVVEAGSAKVLSRAEVKFDREPRQAIAMADDKKAPMPLPPALSDAKKAAPAAVTAKRRVAARERPSEGYAGSSDVIVVRRGDSLWQIARRHFGDGAKYTQIFQTNRGQIRNPDLIYPNQRFALPGR